MIVKTETLVDGVAEVIHAPFALLRRLGVAPAAAMSPGDLRGNAQLLSQGVLGVLWQTARRAPPWEDVSRAWEASARAGHVSSPDLCGAFDPADRVRVVGDNAASSALREALHAGARRTIDLSTYYLQRDDTGRAVAAQLLAAVRRGVRVRLVADAAIVRKKQRDGSGAEDLLHELRAGGVEVRGWHDPARPFDTNHRKLLLVDGAHLLLGGRNIADHYAGPDWRDVEVHVEGPTAASVEALFARTFEGAPEPPGEPGARVRATTPRDLTSHATFVFLLRCLRDARETVDVENAYLFAHPAMVRAIADATRRGVRVRLLTNSAESNDLDFANYRLYAGLMALREAGASVHLRRGRGRTLHCKYFVADRRWVSLGSTNLDYYSPRFCTEANLQVESEALGEELTAWFEEGLRDADEARDLAALARVRDAQTFARVFDRLLRDGQ